MSLKALLNYVLDEVAIDGEEGTTIEELFHYVNNFYVENLQRRHNVSELLWDDQLDRQTCGENGDEGGTNDSTESAKRNPDKGSDFWGFPNVKEEFQEYIWDLLRQEKDFIVGPKNEAGSMTLKNIVEQMKMGGGNDESEQLKVYATEDRRWRTLTGHGPDPRKVPNALFKCLEVIGKHRVNGLIQPELTKITGQDKKSIAGRTTVLKDLGYIEKINVLAKSMNTSKLTLMKFAVQRDQKRAQATKDDEKQKGKAIAGGTERWTGDTIHLESLVNAIILELKMAKNGVIQRGDLKKKLGMDKSRFHWRSLSRILRKVEVFGVWKRIRVPLSSNRTYDKKGGQNVTVRAHARCIKFLRDITEDDLRRLANSSKGPLVEDDEGDDGSDAEDGKDEKENDDMDVDAINEQLARVDVDAIEEVPREVPQWSMNVPMPNIVYSLVQATGKNGMSSMEVVQRVIGSFYYRPMDQVLHRMTDFPSKSQPPQYIHLTVIRETSITHRQTHYHYFSYEWHQELVKEGLANEPWAAQGKKKGVKVKTGSLGEADDQTPKAQELNEFGFPAANSSRLLKKDGSASLAESQLIGKKKENIAALTNQPGWKKGTGGTGRPRKYEKGQEPYLAGKRRRDAQQTPNKRPLEDTQDEEPSSKTPKPRGRPPKKQKTGDTPTIPKRRGRGPTKGKAVAAEAIEVSDTPESTPQTVSTPEPSTTFGAPKLRGTAPKQVAQTPQTAQPTLEATQQTLLDFFQNLTPDVAATHSPTPTRGSRKAKKIAKGRATPTPKATRPTRKRKAASPAPVSQTPGKRGKRSTPAEVDTEMVLPTPEDVPEATQDLPSVLETQETPSQPTAIEVAEIHGPGELSPPDLSTNEQTGGSHPAKEVERPPPETSVAAADDSELAGQNTPFKVDGLSIEAEKLDADNDSYGSIGGMLALGRQQVVLDLVAEHQGVFPGGNELRHAFDKRYKKKNPKAGVADRRLIRGVVQSLQYKGKINQYSFSLQTPRGVAIKKLLVDAKLPLDSPLVIETIRQIKAANGNLWFPPGTDLPPDIQQRMLNPVTTWVQAQPSVVETEFDRMYSTSVHQLKKQERAAQRAARDIQKAEDKEMRAELKRMKQLGGELSAWNGKFTDAQREEARRRKAELKSKIQQLRNKFQTVPNDEADEETGPQTVWWADFVQRTDGNTFLKDVKEVRQMEILMEGREDELFQPSKQDGLVMINHFGPEVKVGEDFRQAPASLDKRIKPPTRTPRTALQLPQPHATAPKLVVEESDNAASVVPIKRRRRRVQKHPPTKSRRQKAMAALHQTTTLDEAGEEQEVHSRKDSTHRNKYTIPKEDEDTLLIAVIIVRTIFGNVDRKINWNLIQKAMPQHEPVVFQRRWPRVRDMHKTHLKKLQSEFEEMYLEAYAKGQLPSINLQQPMSFDLTHHIKWFRDNLELPEAHAVPELSLKREVFDNLYNLRHDKPSPWRADYHNPAFTMGNRANHFVCYAYELPLKTENNAEEGNSPVDYVKSIIKANIMTDAASYNSMEAFALIHAQPEDAVDEAFFELSNNKVIAHRKEHNRVAPGRNYELTDKFHLSLRTPMDEKLFAQALKFDDTLQKMFEQKDALELSPFLNDGSVACIFDLVAHRRVRLEKREYVADTWGLVEGYETRSMPKRLVDFKIDVRAESSYFSRPEVAPLPPTPDGKTGNPMEPIRIWIDMNNSIIKGMWLRVAISVLSLITGRPGIQTKEISRMLYPGLTPIEVMDVANWLNKRGAVEPKGDSEKGLGCWAKEGFYRALGGL